MAATANVRGRFAARTRKAWDSFTDRGGDTVQAGRSLVLHVVTDGDEALTTVKVPKDLLDDAEAATGTLKFGDRIDLSVTIDSYGCKFVAANAPAKAA